MAILLGEKLRVSIFGESHGPAIGVVVEGLPAGEPVDTEALCSFMRRRAPGQGPLSTARKEADEPRFLSGLYGGRLCGDALCIMLENHDAHSADYESIYDIPRPGHADYPAVVRYKGHMDMRGGGPFSGRLTAPLCAAGGIALQILARRGIHIGAHIAEIGGIADCGFDPVALTEDALCAAGEKPFPVNDDTAGERMQAEILAAREAGDSLGGIVECAALGLPAGLGGPLFEGLEGRLAMAIFAIPAVKGLEFGAGFAAARLRGSENNDAYILREGEVATAQNCHGGILGGMSTGMPLLFRVAFKPTPSIAQLQQTLCLSSKEMAGLSIRGRHDPCIVPRALPCVEAAAGLILLDASL